MTCTNTQICAAPSVMRATRPMTAEDVFPTGPAPAARRCVFCHRPGKLTNEHIIPWWLESVARQRLRAGPGGAGGAGRDQVDQDPPPGGDALADEHAEPERERAGPCMRGSMTELFVLGVKAGIWPGLESMRLAG